MFTKNIPSIQRVGKTFNSLTIKELLPSLRDKKGSTRLMCRCQCVCGRIKDIGLGCVIRGNTKTCGCRLKPTDD